MAAAVRAATITRSPAATSTIANWKTTNNNKLVGLGRRGSGEKLGSPFLARLTHNSPPSFSSLSISPDASSSTSPLTSSIGSPPLSPPLQWNLDSRHILALNVIACVAAISASWLFFSAIPTLLSFKRAAESLEKLLDVTREELPDTMAAVRLSGMEISDLTMELSDLGQDITRGVRSSTRAVRLAEDRLRRFTTMAPTGANHAKEQDGGTRGS